MSAATWQRRADFPALAQEVNGRPLVYLDNAATTQKPRAVIDAIVSFYEKDNANVHRGIHTLSERATTRYEGARARLADFFGAEQSAEIIFTRGTTESINLVAQTWGRSELQAGERILLTEMEHHSNIVPWQLLAAETGALIDYVPVHPDTGMLNLEAAERMLRSPVRIFSFTHVSNTLGTVNPAAELCRMASERGIVTLVDAAQSAGHRPINVQEIGCDFLVCSGHKMCGPMGIGVLYARRNLLERMPPWQGGGDMISRVTYERSTWNTVPHKFEAGTPNVEGAIGLHAAVDYLDAIGRERIKSHDAELARYAIRELSTIPGLRILGPHPDDGTEHASSVSFVIEGIHAHDVVTLADRDGIALRGGHHCNQPLMKKLGVPATARASFYFYNTLAEIDALVESLRGICKMFRKG